MRVRDVILGVAIGDAYGAGVEFQDRNWIKANVDFSRFVNARHLIEVPENELYVFTKNYHPWEYTDDTEMTVALIKALVSGLPFSEDLLLEHFLKEYKKGEKEKGYGRNGHGSIAWYYNGEMTIEKVKSFQKNRPNPGNAPAMRAVPIGLLEEKYINAYASINAKATHPHQNAIISSQCIARAAHYLILKEGDPQNLIPYCLSMVPMNNEYIEYLNNVDKVGGAYEQLSNEDWKILCGIQPIEAPYFLAGINGVPSDSKYTTGVVLYILKNSKNTFDALEKSILVGGDVDSVASITTGIMAGIHGLESLPEYMIENVEGKVYLEEIAAIFTDYLGL